MEIPEETAADMRAQARRIRSAGKHLPMGQLDYEGLALEEMARSLEHQADGRTDHAALAVMNASVWAQLHTARASRGRG